MEVESNGVMWDKSACIRILMNITKPLRGIIKIQSSNGRIVVIEVKYERLPIFCNACGKLRHMERDCLTTEEEEERGVKNNGGHGLRFHVTARTSELLPNHT